MWTAGKTFYLVLLIGLEDVGTQLDPSWCGDSLAVDQRSYPWRLGLVLSTWVILRGLERSLGNYIEGPGKVT